MRGLALKAIRTVSVVVLSAGAVGGTTMASLAATVDRDALGSRVGGAIRVNASGDIYYVSPQGNDSNPGTEASPWKTVQHAAEQLTAGETVLIRAGTYPERVEPANSGTAGNPITYAAYPGETPVIDGDSVTLPDDLAGLFEIRGLSYITLSGLRVVNAGPHGNNAGILVADSSDITVEDGSTSNTASSGIGVWGSANVVVSGNEIVDACGGGGQESLTVAGTDTFEVVDNLVHDTSKEGIDAKDGSANGTIHGNVVYNVEDVGIYVDAWDKPTSNIRIYQNVVHDVVNYDGIALASEMGGQLSKIRVYNNIVYRNGAVGIDVTRNGDEGGPHPMRGIVIVNNTVWANGSGWGGGIGIGDPDARGVVVRNNIVSRNTSFQLSRSSDVPKANVTVDHNLVNGYRGAAEDGGIYGASVVRGNPLFVDAPSGDFHLRETSPAIDSGSARGAPPIDFDGTARPQGASYDMGAYER